MEKDQKYENSNEKRSRKTAEKIVGKKIEEKGKLRVCDIENKVF